MKLLTQICILLFLFTINAKGFAQDFNTDINQAFTLNNEGKYVEAAELFTKLLPKAKRKFGENDTSVYLKLLSKAGICYYRAGRYEQSEPLLKEAMRIDKETLGENHPSYSIRLNNLAMLYQAMGRYEQAEPLMKEAMRIDKETLGENNPSYGTRLNNLAMLYFELGRYEQAEPFMLEALQIDKVCLGENHPDYGSDLNNLAQLYQAMGRYEQAESLMKEAMRIAKESLGENHPSYSSTLNNLALLYQAMGQYEQAELLMKDAIIIDKETLGENHPSYGIRLNNLAALYQAMGRYEQAELIMKETMHIDKESFGENHPSYGICLNNLAQLYQAMGRYEEAEPLMKMVMRIDKESFGENHPSYGKDMNNLALLYQAMGRYEQAEPLIKEAMRIDKESLGENHPEYGSDLNNLAQLYQAMGRYEQSEPLMKKAMRIDKESLGENHPSYGVRLNNLAQLYQAMGLYEQAEPLMKEAMRITKKSLGKYHPSYGTRLNNLSLLYIVMGRYEQAEPLIKEAILIDKESLGENHPFYGRSLNNLAYLYQYTGRYEEAEPLMIESMRIAKASLGEDHPDFANGLNNLSLLYLAMGRYEQAEPLIKEAIRIDKESLGVNHPSYGRNLNNLAALYQAMGRYEQAEPLMIESMQIAKEFLGEDHPEYGTDLNNLALLYQGIGQYEKAEPLMKDAFSILKDNLIKNSGYLSETEMNQFVETLFYILEVYLSINYYLSVSENENDGFALDIELYRKALQLKSVIETRKRIETSGDTSLIHSYQTMIAIRKQAYLLYSFPPEKRPVDPDKLEEKANEMEKDLKLRSKEYSRSLEEAEITWRQIQEKMKPDEAIVEFASFGYYNKQWTDSTLYCALVLRRQDTIPQMVYLFEEKQLAEALPKSGNSSDATINNTYAILRGNQLVQDSSWYQGDNLYNLVWKPLDSLLSGIKTVNYACSGLLNTVSFAAVPDASGKLLCEKYALNQYSSTRNLVIETKELPITDATIYGGIHYELDTSLMIANSRQYSKTNDFTLAYNSTRSGNKRGNGFDDLEGTREEANAISILFKEKKITTNNYTGAAANEDSFKAMASKKSPSVIHLSTHGFYYPDTTAQRKRSNEIQFIGSDLNRFQYSPDPLLRSGIVLAGANRVWRGEPIPDRVEDGILTAKDVSQLNLNNTQLVVLSACQTGLGDVKGSEGVFGLQRAFKMAGVKYLMMSLWSVPDKETKEFMEKFYSNWLSGKPIRMAFQKTQQEMRLEYPKEPYKWAAFVLVE